MNLLPCIQAIVVSHDIPGTLVAGIFFATQGFTKLKNIKHRVVGT